MLTHKYGYHELENIGREKEDSSIWNINSSAETALRIKSCSLGDQEHRMYIFK